MFNFPKDDYLKPGLNIPKVPETQSIPFLKMYLLCFLQVTHFGCKSFALLFDDIDHNMCPADKEVFSSFAHAQVSLTNEIYQYLGEPETFLFCPTGTTVIFHKLFFCFCKIYIVLNACVICFCRVLWDVLLPKCLAISLPPHGWREIAA